MEGEDQSVNNNIYDIPLTDPAAPPFGAPGAGGTLPPPPGVLPPDAAPSVDFSQLPPPVAPGSETMPDAAPAASASAPPAGPTPDSQVFTDPDFDQNAFPPPAAMPGFTPPPPPDLRVPSFDAPAVGSPVAPPAPVSAEAVIDDEFARAARANADSDLLHCLNEVLLAGAS